MLKISLLFLEDYNFARSEVIELYLPVVLWSKMEDELRATRKLRKDRRLLRLNSMNDETEPNDQ